MNRLTVSQSVKAQARTVVWQAIKNGELKREASEVCGNPATKRRRQLDPLGWNGKHRPLCGSCADPERPG
jgi:hypothetical protein